MGNTKKTYHTVIVDDDPDLVNYVKDILEEQYNTKLTITSFGCPKDAFTYIKKNEIAILISDMRMPGISGDNFLNMCIELNKGIKTISMTGYPGLGTMMSRFRNGDIGYLVKPFNDHQLYKFVNIALKSLESWNPILSQSA